MLAVSELITGIAERSDGTKEVSTTTGVLTILNTSPDSLNESKDVVPFCKTH